MQDDVQEWWEENKPGAPVDLSAIKKRADAILARFTSSSPAPGDAKRGDSSGGAAAFDAEAAQRHAKRALLQLADVRPLLLPRKEFEVDCRQPWFAEWAEGRFVLLPLDRSKPDLLLCRIQGDPLPALACHSTETSSGWLRVRRRDQGRSRRVC